MKYKEILKAWKDKKTRKGQIKFQLESIKIRIRKARVEADILEKELDFIRGHYDKTWEEEYNINSSEC